MKIELNLTKTRFFVIVICMFLISGAFFVYAYNSGFNRLADQGAVFGHSADELVVKMSDGSLKTVQEILVSSSSQGVPAHTVIFYNGATCPAGWSEIVSARGRYLVGLSPGGNLGGVIGTALSNSENRATGAHVHLVNVGCTFGNGLSDGSKDNHAVCPLESGIAMYNGVDAPAGTNAPYLQYLVCEKS